MEMLSQKIIEMFKNATSLNEGDSAKCLRALEILDIDKNSIFGQFSLMSYHSNGFYSNHCEDIDNVCKSIIDDDFYVEYLKASVEVLNLPPEYIIIGDFDGEGGFFYNRKTGEVLELDLRDLKDFHAGKLKPQFKDFNTFLEWFFELN